MGVIGKPCLAPKDDEKAPHYESGASQVGLVKGLIRQAIT
jgi:hypothetical protein